MNFSKKFFLLLGNLCLAFTVAAQGFGEATVIDSDWYFTLSDPKYAGSEFHDHSSWRKLSLPHDWSIEAYASPEYASCMGFLPGGIGWYRKELNIPANFSGKQVFVYFEGVYNNSEVYINGKWIGKRPNGYVSFMYELTPYLKFGGRNVIAVKVDHSQAADSRWYTGSGIYRHVKLVIADPIHIGLWGVSYSADVDSTKATIRVKTRIENQVSDAVPVTVIYELLSKEGKVVAHAEQKVTAVAGESTPVEQQLSINHPKLWNLETPYLYQLRTSVIKNGAECDRSTINVGLRKLSFDANHGFALNGKPMKFKGVCLHQDAGCFGVAVPEEVWVRRIRQLKSIGCNAIRTSHNPQAESFYDICDREGMLVDDEAFDEWEYPKKKWVEGWNKGTPVFQGSAQYFREWGKRDLADMIRRDRNHPSIIMWCIGNEVDYPNDPYSHPILNKEGIDQPQIRGYQSQQPRAERLGEIARELVAVVKKEDTSRPATAALAGAVMSNQTDYPFVLDIVGYNYTERRYAQDHATYPKRILYGSENRHDMAAWRAVADNEYIMGQFLWTGIDYLGESHPWPSRGFNTGLINLAGYVKPLGYFRRALWSETPMAYLGTYEAGKKDQSLRNNAEPIWNYRIGEKINVVTYTNCEEALLMLNGRKVGERKAYDKQTGIIGWTVPFKSGELKVICYNKGKTVTEETIHTTGSPYAIQAEVVKPTLQKSGLYHILITVVDTDGRPVVMADNEITCQIEGGGELLGLESGDNNATDNYRDNRQRCLKGRLTAYVNISDRKKTKVTFTSPYLKEAVVEL